MGIPIILKRDVFLCLSFDYFWETQISNVKIQHDFRVYKNRLFCSLDEPWDPSTFILALLIMILHRTVCLITLPSFLFDYLLQDFSDMMPDTNSSLFFSFYRPLQPKIRVRVSFVAYSITLVAHHFARQLLSTLRYWCPYGLCNCILATRSHCLVILNVVVLSNTFVHDI